MCLPGSFESPGEDTECVYVSYEAGKFVSAVRVGRHFMVILSVLVFVACVGRM